MDRLHPILLFSRSIFDASAHAAGKGGGADVAALEGEQLVQRLVMSDAGDLLHITDGQHLAPVAGFQDLLQVVPVCWVFYCITSNLTQKHRHTQAGVWRRSWRTL